MALAFIVLVTVRFLSLACQSQSKGVHMQGFNGLLLLSAVLESTWAIGTSIVAAFLSA